MMTLFKSLSASLILFASLPFAQAELEHPYFYSASKNGITSYILGSFHIGVDLSELPTPVLAQIKNSKTLLAEMKMTRPTVQEFLDHPESDFPIGDIEKFGPLTEPNIQRMIKKGVPEAVARQMADDACFGGIFAPYYFPKILSIDFRIYDMAYHLRMDYSALDSPEIRTEAKALKTESECSLNGILNTLSDDQIDQMRNELITAYRTGTLKCEDDPESNYRTAAWLSQILSRTNNKSTLIVVGVCHVIGDHGLLKMLQDRGYEIRRY